MLHDSRRLTIIVSQAAHHLHAVVGSVSTALLDVGDNPRMLFSNSALAQVGGKTLTALAHDYVSIGCESYPCLHMHVFDDDDRVIYLTILDTQHVFVVIGGTGDEMRIREFVSRLTHLLPANRPVRSH